jgi:hypothetical protein
MSPPNAIPTSDNTTMRAAEPPPSLSIGGEIWHSRLIDGKIACRNNRDANPYNAFNLHVVPTKRF